MRITGLLELKGTRCFQAKHVVGVDKSLADLITRCEPSKINAELNRRRSDVPWCEQVMGREEKCLRGDTP